MIFSAARCSEGSVRLVEGETAVDGIVQLCHEEDWGTVCANGWDNTDASVVCRQVGLSPIGAQPKHTNMHACIILLTFFLHRFRCSWFSIIHRILYTHYYR